MSRPTRMCGLMLLAALGCAQQQQVVRFSRLNESTTVELCERDAGAEGNQPQTRALLDDPQRIAKVAAVVNSRQDEWRSVGGTPLETRYTIVFRRDGDATQTFHFQDEYLGTRLAEGDARARSLSAAETKLLFDAFQFPANFRAK